MPAAPDRYCAMPVIALDAMGGDFSPRAPAEAAARAAAAGSDFDVMLVGERALLQEQLARRGGGEAVAIRHAPEFVAMDESPAEALRRKPGASVREAFEAVKRGEAAGVVTAGNSGAAMIAGKMVLKTLPGIDRPALATHLPHRRGQTVFLDSGANVDSKPAHLLQFAWMGATYARLVLEKSDPRVALLSNGVEEGKGNDVNRKAFKLLRESRLHFVGNLEPRDLFKGKAEVVVSDGFAGNLVLKTAEAASSEVRLFLRESVFRSPARRLGYWLLRGFFLDLARRTDYREIGGSLLLGLRGVAVVCHGSSNARTIQNALGLAARCAARNLVAEISRDLPRQSGRHTASA